jgi:hypothetical protein
MKCKHCGEEKIEGQAHRHCGDCGCIIRKGKTQHRVDCGRLGLDERYYCATHKRLLAAGAVCAGCQAGA